MSSTEILKKMAQRSPAERLFLVEKTLKSLIKTSTAEQASLAAEAMGNDYKCNANLTAFPNLDFENFYEAK
jgi:hypothetical protein